MLVKHYRFSLFFITLFFVLLSGYAQARSDVNGDGWSDVLGFYNYGGATAGVWTIMPDGAKAVPSLAWVSGRGCWDWARSSAVTGNFNSDTLADQAVLYDYGKNTTGLWLFRSDGAHLTPSLVWASGRGSWDWSRSKVAAGDFNHDGLDEVYVLYDYGGAQTGLWIFQSNGTSFTPTRVWISAKGAWDWNRSKIATTDFDGNGFDDLVIMYDYGQAQTGLWAMFSDGAHAAPARVWLSGPGEWDWNRSNLTAGNFTGDAHGDIGILYRYDNSAAGLWFFKSDGAAASPGLAWASGPGNWDWYRSKITAGNFTGDARDDVAVLYDYGGSSTNLWFLRSDDTSAVPVMGWGSGRGSWSWQRTNLANSQGGGPRGDPVYSIIGYSVLGRPIPAARIGNGPRRYLFVGAHHGNEPAGGRLLELWRDYLLAHPEVVPAGVEVWIVPYLNPDGVAAGTRWNARGVNLNRNYWTSDWGIYDVTSVTGAKPVIDDRFTDMWAVATGVPFTFNYPGPRPFSEPETVSIASLCANTAFRAMINFHDSEGCVYWSGSGGGLASVYTGRLSLPLAGGGSPMSGTASQWFSATTGNAAVTIEMTAAQADADPNGVFNVYLPALLATINY
jgi:hypothetical protein